jgi:transcriptional regulator with XRE-family HTH domain
MSATTTNGICDPTLIGGRIRQARLALGMSQQELVEALGHNHSNRSMVSSWENATWSPGADNLYRLARVLRRPTDWFLGLPPHHPRRGRRAGNGR